MQYDVNNGLLQVVIEGEEINAVVGEAAQINVGEAINYIQSGKAEIEEAVEEGISDFNENATEKTNEFDLNAQNKTSDFNTNATQKTLDFNSNASNKTSEFNLNAQDKTSDFNANAVEKTNDFNSNAQDKTGDFNDNAVDKTNDFNENASDKTNDFNLNAQNKTSDFNDNYTEKKGLIDAQVVIAEGAATTATNQAGLAKQWAIGDPSEPTGNSAKYWATQASNSATSAATSEDHSEVWAEGTDQEVQALGGVHSAKGWADQSAQGQVQSNWAETDTTAKSYIQNKPTTMPSVWGKISGTLSNQTDLQNALNAKANDSDVVKLTGNQTINDIKTFTGNIHQRRGGTYSTTPASDQTFGQISFWDSTSKLTTMIDNYTDTSGNTKARLITYLPTDTSKHCNIEACIDSSGNAYTYAPTPATSDNSTKIATTAFVKAQGYAAISSIFPVGSCYVTIGNTNPNTILGVGTWTLVTSSVITSINTNVPVKGTGMTLGLTDGTTNYGISPNGGSQMIIGSTAIYGKPINTKAGGSFTGGAQSLGITTDPAKSGIVGTVTRTSTTLYIWQRTA